MRSTSKLLAFACATTILLSSSLEAEQKFLDSVGDFVFVEFSDPFDEKVTGYTIASHNVRFDLYDNSNKEFISLILKNEQLEFFQKNVEQSFRFINPTYPKPCNLWGDDKDFGCEIGSLIITPKLSMKVDGKHTITVCYEKYSGQFGNCDIDVSYAGGLCHSGFDNPTPSKVRECVENKLSEFNFFYETTELAEYLYGERLYLRLELIELRDGGEDDKEYRVLGKYDFPTDHLTGVTKLFDQRGELSEHAFSN